MIVGVTEDRNGGRENLNEMMSLGSKIASNKDRVLCEDQRIGKRYTMGEMLEGLEEGMVKSQTAIMLDNTRKYIDNMDEATKLVNIGDFEKYAFPMVRAIFPNLAAHNLASVQPMLGPVSLVFFMKFLYGRSKGRAVAGQDVIENPNKNYSSEEVVDENIGTGTGASTVIGTGTVDYSPLKPGSIVLTATSSSTPLEITDDGNGNLIGDIGGGTNTVNYVTGAIAVDWSAAPDSATEVLISYTYDFEASESLPSIDMQLTSSPVTARTRKLTTRWSLEAAQDLRNLHGLEAEVEQVAAISNELKFEIDREIIDDMVRIASNSVASFDKTPGAGISFTEHKLFFVDRLIQASNTIFQSTQRATGTWMICGINVASLIESLPGFVPSPRPKGTRAVYKAGVLNGTWEIWKDPNFATNDYLMGYQGDSMWEVGYIFAPYILAFTTATIMLDDFIGRKGMASRYGKKTIDGRFYCKGSIFAS